MFAFMCSTFVVLLGKFKRYVWFERGIQNSLHGNKRVFVIRGGVVSHHTSEYEWNLEEKCHDVMYVDAS